MKILFSYEDEDFEYQEDYVEDESEEGEGYYRGYDDDDYQSPDSEYEDE